MEDNFALHAVIIKKPITLEEARSKASNIIKDDNKTFYRETKNSYRFRNIPKQKFKPKTFRTKKIRGQPISLVFGELKPDFVHLKGSGIFDYFKEKAQQVKKGVKDFFSPRLTDFNNVSKNTLRQYGNLPIKTLTIYRTPIKRIYDRIINVISLGKWDELKQKFGFDNLFHLALVANVGNKNIIIEKNQAVNVSTSYETNNDTETLDIPLGGATFTVSNLLDTARRNVGDTTFFSYDAFKNNCQFFIKYLLEGKNLYSEDAKNFLFQDLESIYEGLPSYVPKTIKAITDIGATYDKLSGGEVGGSKKAGFIRAIMSGKNIAEPKQFRKYNKEGFDPEKIKKASGNVIDQLITDDFYNFIIKRPKLYYIGDATYNLPKAFEDYLSELDDKSPEWKNIQTSLDATKYKFKDTKPKTPKELKSTLKKVDLKAIQEEDEDEDLSGEGRPIDTKLLQLKTKLKDIRSKCKTEKTEISDKLKSKRTECKGIIEEQKGDIQNYRKSKPRKSKKEPTGDKLIKEIIDEPINDLIVEPKKISLEPIVEKIEPKKEKRAKPIIVASKYFNFVKPKKKKLETWDDLFSSTTFTDKQFELWARKELPVYLANSHFTFFFTLDLLRKYKEDCIVVGGIPTDPESKEVFQGHSDNKDKFIQWIWTNDYKSVEGKKNPPAKLFPNLPLDEFFKEVGKCRTGGQRFVAIPISLRLLYIKGSKIYDRDRGDKDKGVYHANMLLIDLKTNTAEYYEPHGEYTYVGNDYLNVEIYKLQYVLEDIFNDYGYEYKTPEMTCPRVDNKVRADLSGLQAISSEEGGFCENWSRLYLNLRLAYPDLDPAELNTAVATIFNQEPDKARDFIMSYSQNSADYLADLILKDKLTPEELITFYEGERKQKEGKSKREDIEAFDLKPYRKVKEIVLKDIEEQLKKKPDFGAMEPTLLKGITRKEIRKQPIYITQKQKLIELDKPRTQIRDLLWEITEVSKSQRKTKISEIRKYIKLVFKRALTDPIYGFKDKVILSDDNTGKKYTGEEVFKLVNDIVEKSLKKVPKLDEKKDITDEVALAMIETDNYLDTLPPEVAKVIYYLSLEDEPEKPEKPETEKIEDLKKKAKQFPKIKDEEFEKYKKTIEDLYKSYRKKVDNIFEPMKKKWEDTTFTEEEKKTYDPYDFEDTLEGLMVQAEDKVKLTKADEEKILSAGKRWRNVIEDIIIKGIPISIEEGGYSYDNLQNYLRKLPSPKITDSKGHSVSYLRYRKNDNDDDYSFEDYDSNIMELCDYILAKYDKD